MRRRGRVTIDKPITAGVALADDTPDVCHAINADPSSSPRSRQVAPRSHIADARI